MLDKAKNKGDMKPYLRNLNVRWFGFDLSDVSEMRFTSSESSKYTIAKGDLVICEGGYPGRAAIWTDDQPIFFQKALHRVRFHDQRQSKWVLYYLYKADLDGTLKRYFSGTGIQHFTGEALARLQVPLPPFSEQDRILGILDQAFDGLATAKTNAEKNRENAVAIFQASLESAMSGQSGEWVPRRLGEVLEIGSSKRIYESEWTSSGVPFYGGREIVKLSRSDVPVSDAYISETKYLEYASRYDMPTAGDILITARGTIGVGYVVREGDRFYYKDGNIISLRAKVPTNPKFILYAFGSRILRDQLSDLTGATVTHLPLEKAKELVLPIPDMATQDSVVARLERIEGATKRLESICHQKLTALDLLKKSLLHEAFSGNL